MSPNRYLVHQTDAEKADLRIAHGRLQMKRLALGRAKYVGVSPNELEDAKVNVLIAECRLADELDRRYASTPYEFAQRMLHAQFIMMDHMLKAEGAFSKPVKVRLKQRRK